MRCLLLLVLAGCPEPPLTSASQSPPGSEPWACQNTVEYQAGSRGSTGVYAYDHLGRFYGYAQTDESYRFERRFDEHGRRAVEREHVLDLGPVDRVATWTYDDLDRPLRVTSDHDGKITITDYEYDAAGRIARRTTRSEHSSSMRFEYIEGEPFVVATHYENSDGVELFATRYSFEAHHRIVRMENVKNNEVDAYVDYLYDDNGHLKIIDSHWGGHTVNEYVWSGDRMIKAYYTSYYHPTEQSMEYAYDDRGRVVRRDWHTGQGYEFTTTAVWGDAGLEHVERRDAVTNKPIESWTIDRECSGEMPALIYPVTVWEREVDPNDHATELADYFPDAV